MTTLPQPTTQGAVGLRPRRWTVAQFHRLGDLGIFEGCRAKLIDGFILEEGPMNGPHADSVQKITLLMVLAFGRNWLFRCQLPLVLGQYLDPMPDFAIVAAGTSLANGHPTTAELVIEVADTSLDYDTQDKRLIYAQAGVRDYWVVDINGQRLLVYRNPQNGDYTSQQRLGPTDTISPLALPTASITVADLLP